MNFFRWMPSSVDAPGSDDQSRAHSGTQASEPGLFGAAPGGPELNKADEIIRLVAARRERLRKG